MRGGQQAVARGFTLIELLIVIAIISILAGMTLGVIIMVKERAKDLSTQSRMQAVLNGLVQYSSGDGSPVVGLQTKLNLGGVQTFATVKNLLDSNPPAFAKPAGFIEWYGNPGPPATTWNVTVDSSNYNTDPERLAIWRRLTDEVFEVMPIPGVGSWASTDYTTYWPSQWPETDWDLATPGSNPPILRFPWGKPGLRIDATLCDPNADSTNTGKTVSEGFINAGHHFVVSSPQIMNRWVTCGSPVSTRLWTWSTSSPAETADVQITTCNRSDGNAYVPADSMHNSNVAMPFDMGWMSPLATIRLLQAADVLKPGTVGEDDYRSGRKPSSPWNDAWGNPLVVTYAMFQPERFVRTFDGQNRRDFLMRGAMKEYQYNRSIYLAVGDPGPDLTPAVAGLVLPKTWIASDDAITLRDYWKQIRFVTDAKDWNENAFASPPWDGIRLRKKSGVKCLVTAPNEVK